VLLGRGAMMMAVMMAVNEPETAGDDPHQRPESNAMGASPRFRFPSPAVRSDCSRPPHEQGHVRCCYSISSMQGASYRAIFSRRREDESMVSFTKTWNLWWDMEPLFYTFWCVQ